MLSQTLDKLLDKEERLYRHKALVFWLIIFTDLTPEEAEKIARRMLE
jgi:hypothetical protein